MTEHALIGFNGTDQPSASIFDTCIRCGLCLPSCPTYLETMTETSGPRGRISLIKAVGESRLDLLSAGFVEQMWECLDCRACEAVCPSGVRYGQLVETARTQIRRAQAPTEPARERTLRRFLLRTLFARLDLMRLAATLLRFAQQTRLISLAGPVGLATAAKLAPKVSSTFFVARDQRFEAAAARGVAFLHAGCIMPVAFAEVHRATVRMLLRAGLSVIVPSGQGCCGAIAVHAGDMDFGRELAKRNIDAFERSGADVYVVNAAGCGSALKEYAELFAGDPAWAHALPLFHIESATLPKCSTRSTSVRRRAPSTQRSPTKNPVTSFTRNASPERHAVCSRAFLDCASSKWRRAPSAAAAPESTT